MFKASLLLGILCIVLIISCSQTPKEKSTESNSGYKSNYAERLYKNPSKIDWQGTYKGFLPCEDCVGIESKLTLNPDNTYILKTKFVGRSNEIIESKGTFSWNNEGTKIILDSIKNAPNQYLIRENEIIQLDIDGNQIFGNDQDEYVFVKDLGNNVNPFYKELVDKKWRLIEINGNPVPMPKDDKLKPAELFFDSKTSRILAFGGCNEFFTNFSIATGTKIFFGKIYIEQVNCPQIEIESKLLNIFEKTDNFDIINDIMIFRKAKSAPVARFQLVK